MDQSKSRPRIAELPLAAQALVVNPDGIAAARLRLAADLRLQFRPGTADLYPFLDRLNAGSLIGMRAF